MSEKRLSCTLGFGVKFHGEQNEDKFRRRDKAWAV